MKNHAHEQIQRWLDGQSGAEEAAALHKALNTDAETRALYLDYVNLDAALGAMAGVAAIAENGNLGTMADQRRIDRPSRHYWRWVATAAACAAAVMLVVLTKQRDAARAQPDIVAVTASAHAAILRLPADVPPVLPAWLSPTASLLDQPSLPK